MSVVNESWFLKKSTMDQSLCMIGPSRKEIMFTQKIVKDQSNQRSRKMMNPEATVGIITSLLASHHHLIENRIQWE